MVIFFFIFASAICGVFKAIADRVSSYDLWVNSVFSEFEDDGFFGPKDITWERKYRYDSKIARYLFSTILVFTTDIWHFANFVSFYHSVAVVVLAVYIGEENILWLISFPAVRTLTFHIFYHYILYRKSS